MKKIIFAGLILLMIIQVTPMTARTKFECKSTEPTTEWTWNGGNVTKCSSFTITCYEDGKFYSSETTTICASLSETPAGKWFSKIFS